MSKVLSDYIELEDEHGEAAFFRVESELIVNNARYAVLTHVDEEGQDLADESTLFWMDMDDEQETVAFEPVEDEALVEKIEEYLSRLESQ